MTSRARVKARSAYEQGQERKAVVQAARAANPEIEKALGAARLNLQMEVDLLRCGANDLARDAYARAQASIWRAADLYCQDPVMGRLIDSETAAPILLCQEQQKVYGANPDVVTWKGKAPPQVVQIKRASPRHETGLG